MSQRVQIPEQVMMREVGGEAVILNIETEQYFGLDEIGTRMWATLTSTDSVQQAIDLLLEEYEVGAERLASDIRGFIDALVAEGLLEVSATSVSGRSASFAKASRAVRRISLASVNRKTAKRS
jgi:hypothetical protein